MDISDGSVGLFPKSSLHGSGEWSGERGTGAVGISADFGGIFEVEVKLLDDCTNCLCCGEVSSPLSGK
jgi:hypothetical protein